MAFDWFKKSAPERRPEDRPVQPEILYLNSGIGVGLIKWSNHIAVSAAMQHPITYRALNKIAESVQQVRWFAEVDPQATKADQTGNQSAIQSINDLLNHPNPDMTPAQLRYWLALNFASYGRVPLKFSFSPVDTSKPTGIYPLETRLVKAEMDARGVVARYTYGDGDTKQVWPSRELWAKKKDAKGFVSAIWKPGLKGYQHHQDANTPLDTVGLPAQVIRALLIRAIQTAEGHPNVRYMVTCDKSLTQPQKDALKKYLNDDHSPTGEEAGKIPILQNAGNIQIHKLDNNLSDIHSKMPSDDMARLIFGAFGIPIALAGMGAADGAKFAGNYVESRQAFWQDTVIPGYVEPIFQSLSKDLCPPGVRISADFDSIPAIMQGRISSMKDATAISFLTTDEKRELFGFGKTTAIPQAMTPPAQRTTPDAS
jgi:phage portal protein BeeE